MRNNWTRAAVLYNPDGGLNSFRLFQNKINGKADLSFVSLANPDYLPLVALKSTFVRVIVSFLRGETLGRTLCVAYRMGMTYPKYQWLLFGSYPKFPEPFVYNPTIVTRLMWTRAKTSCISRAMLINSTLYMQSRTPSSIWTM